MALSFLKKYCEVILKRNIFLLVFFLSGCCLFSNNQVSFVYNTLPVAVVGMNYHVKVNTRGLPVSMMSVENGHAIHGLKIIPSPTTNVSRWYVDISGIPEREGEYSFWVYGSTVGTQCPGRDFKKKFTLIVVNSKQDK